MESWEEIVIKKLGGWASGVMPTKNKNCYLLWTATSG